LALKPATTPDIASMMYKLGLSAIESNGQVLHNDGRIESVKMLKPLTDGGGCTPNEVVTGRVRKVSSSGLHTSACGSGDGTIDPNSGLVNIGWVTANPAPYSLSVDWTGSTDVLSNPDEPTKVIFFDGRQDRPPNCAEKLGAAVGAAAAMAAYMRDNAWKYTGAMNAAVNNVFNKYQGTTLGIAAALEFIGIVIAGVGAGELLLILGVVVGGAVAIWAMVTCYGGG
jgi:hypothetical protein